MTTLTAAPEVDWVDPKTLVVDPYPTYARLREEAPVAFVPSLGRYFVTRFQDCFDVEMDHETFSSHEDEKRSTMIRAMGRPMLRLDDPQHKVERNAIAPALRPMAIKKHWMPIFHEIAEKHAATLREAGAGADLFKLFAVPYVADSLSHIIGFRNVTPGQFMDWSHTFIAGIGNVTNDARIWQETARVCEEVDDAIEEAVTRLSVEPDASMISSMLAAGMDLDRLRTNVRLTISGGMNEPSHVISGAIWSLTQAPEQRARVLAGESTWRDVFEETARVHSPVGMYPRLVTRDTEIGGVRIPAGSTVAVVGASANRDERKFADADQFDLTRESAAHLAFGNGTHICAGNWVARSMVGEVALPFLYGQFPELTVVQPDGIEFRGWVFRGTKSLPVEWS
ncbi:MAG: cytochrome P450 [Gulosibacter sp.]|uniref:cytochrome P450 n=1 Tax=Gulosibacter sp. TaxID=2817531 RepID=UPI003F8E7C7C